jgi:hypothetical protein
MLALGCAKELPPKFSGFLDDYSVLRPSQKLDGALVWKNKAKRLNVYKMIIIDPVQVYMSDEDIEKVGAERTQDLARYFEDEIRTAMEDSYPIVDHSGFGVLRIRAALTNVRRGRPLLNLTPAFSYLGFGLGGAAIEAELLDTQTGECVVAFVDSQRGKAYRKTAGARPYGDARDVLRSWAILLRDGLDQARGLHTSSDFRTLGEME